MIRASVLLGVGAAAGIWGSRWARRRIRALSPAGLADSVGDTFDRARAEVRGFVTDVRIAADEREREILAALGASAGPELTHDRHYSGTIV